MTFIMKKWKNKPSEHLVSPKKNQSSSKELYADLVWYNYLVAIYGKERVASAVQSLDIIGKFFGKLLEMKNTKMLDSLCHDLVIYQNSDHYVSSERKWFGSDVASMTYAFAEDLVKDKTESLGKENNQGIYNFLKTHLSKDSKCADLFCGWQSGRRSSLYGTALIFSLLGINKILAVDLFNQDNKIEPYDWDYSFPPMLVKDLIPEENIKELQGNDKWASVILDFNIFSVKMDAYKALASMPDNSLDSIMINNVDWDIVQKEEYRDLLRSEIKRVVKNKWLVFGYGTEIWPRDLNPVFEKYFFKAFENDK